jgi:phosphatidylinositol kinase/protein kinase (PI-3  family)
MQLAPLHRGLTLPVPELVPFRLTPVMVAALGPTVGLCTLHSFDP